MTTVPPGERTQYVLPIPEYDLVVRSRTTVAKNVVHLALANEDGKPLPEWDAGSHVELVFGDMVRQFSLCGDRRDRSQWEIAVLLEQESRGGSVYVHENLQPGSQVHVRGPRNNFLLVEGSRYLFIAGGIGITPILPMVETVRAAGVSWTLLYGGRTRESMAFTDLVTKAADADPNGRVELCPQDEFGLLDLDSFLAASEPGDRVYCCGPEPLLQAVEKGCAEHGIESLHVERFRAVESDAPSGSFQIELRRSGRTLTVGADETMLEVLEQAGVDVLSSCGEGTCGTCITAVLEGQPDHRDAVLTEAERVAGKEVLPCISRSLSTVLVLDV